MRRTNNIANFAGIEISSEGLDKIAQEIDGESQSDRHYNRTFWTDRGDIIGIAGHGGAMAMTVKSKGGGDTFYAASPRRIASDVAPLWLRAHLRHAKA